MRITSNTKQQQICRINKNAQSNTNVVKLACYFKWYFNCIDKIAKEN